MIGVIILAAGDSLRMGRPKALLPIDGTTFLGRILDNYRLLNAGTIALVLGADAPAVARAISTDDLTVVINRHTDRGQLTSLLEGLAALPSCDLSGVIVDPVDHRWWGLTPVDHRRALQHQVSSFHIRNPAGASGTSSTCFGACRRAPSAGAGR